MDSEQRAVTLKETFGKDLNRISLNINNVQERKQNSYLRAYLIFEFRAMIQSAILQQTANCILETSYAVRILNTDKLQILDFIVYGTTLGLLTLGFYTDVIARRNLYTLVASLIVFQILFVGTETIYMICTSSTNIFINNDVAAFFQGYYYCLATVLQLQQIPLYIAGRYRDLNSAWELPLAGQMLGLAQVFVLWLPSILGPVIYEIFVGIFPNQKDLTNSGKTGTKWLVLLILCCSVIPLLPLLKFESAQRRINRRKRLQTSSISRSQEEISAQMQGNRGTAAFGQD